MSIFEYKPYKGYKILTIILILGAICSSIAAVYGDGGSYIDSISLGCIAIIAVLMSFTAFNLSKNTIVINDEAIKIIYKKSIDVVEWDKISNIYFYTTYKGYRFLILSERKMMKSEIRKILIRDYLLGKTYRKNVIFFVFIESDKNSSMELFVTQKAMQMAVPIIKYSVLPY